MIDREMPIPQAWIKKYCDTLFDLAQSFSPGKMQDATLHRLECVIDMMEAWQKRYLPVEKR